MVKTVLKVIHKDITVLVGVFFFNWPFVGPFATSPTWEDPKMLSDTQHSMGLLFLSALLLNAQLVVFLQRREKTA